MLVLQTQRLPLRLREL